MNVGCLRVCVYQTIYELRLKTTHWPTLIIYLRQRKRSMFLPARRSSFFCLSVCLSVCLLARLLKNACMDLDEMLRVDRCRDMDELINF